LSYRKRKKGLEREYEKTREALIGLWFRLDENKRNKILALISYSEIYQEPPPSIKNLAEKSDEELDEKIKKYERRTKPRLVCWE
jgi:hypothetical protein